MTLMAELGLDGPHKLLSAEDRRRYHNEYRRRHRDHYNARQRANRDPVIAAKNWAKYYAENQEKLRQKEITYRLKNKDVLIAKQAAYRAANREKIKEVNRVQYYKNRERNIARSVAYQAANKEKVRAREKAWFKRRYDSDPQFKIANRLRSRLYELLRKRNQHASVTLKLNKAALVEHIERQFMPGMSWENHGTVWHVDHIIPCAEFDLTDPKQVMQCFGIFNLQPLWKRENIQKSAKIMRQTELNLSDPDDDAEAEECSELFEAQ